MLDRVGCTTAELKLSKTTGPSYAGALGLVGEHLVAGVRQRVYARSLPLATRNLQIRSGRLGAEAGVRGLAHELSRRVLLGAATA
ncbi:hypothetical protein [Nocardioides aurantiacus]|uniref:hypothetical protein n=1 Tax=Nocardioides aurantiacus TaxID=86796 RepID=UPI00403F009B